jgi:hypothetical protein
LKQRRPPARSHGLPRHPEPGVLTEPLTPQLTSRESSRQVGGRVPIQVVINR